MPSGDVAVNHGESLDFKVKVNEGWKIYKVKTDGKKIDLGNDAGMKFEFLLENIISDHSVKAVFKKVHIITASASPPEAGVIEPSGEIPVTDGEDQTFIVKPNPGYENWDINVLANGEPQGDLLVHTVENADRDVEISVILTPPEIYHSADYAPDFHIGLEELLRSSQLHSSGSYHCNPDSEDGYAPGYGDRSCRPHNSDYNPQDWRINLSELLRLIQLYNFAEYHQDENAEDGFAIGSGE